MDLYKIEQYAKECINWPGNFVQESYALTPQLVGLPMYEAPLIGIAAADDPYFQHCQEPAVVGPHHNMPKDWLTGANTVISFFFPLSPQVCKANGRDFSWPAAEWLHARIEGNQFLLQFTADVRDALISEGYECVAPCLDPRFQIGPGDFTSNWSERHAAYACGLGTFSLTKGLITKKGMAGRLTSLITNWRHPATEKQYEQFDQWCIYCGACINHCPAKAISRTTGKDQHKCDQFLEQTRRQEAPRYGCGKCQVKVPCENKAPGLTR